MEDFDNPIELIKSSLTSIEDKVDNLSRSIGSAGVESKLAAVATSLRTIADSIETDDAREQHQAEMIRHITEGVTTHMSNVSNAIDSFNRDIGDKINKLSNIQVVGRLSPEDRIVMQELNRTLSITDTEGKVAQAQRTIQQTANEAVKHSCFLAPAWPLTLSAAFTKGMFANPNMTRELQEKLERNCKGQ